MDGGGAQAGSTSNWGGFFVNALEAEHYDSITEMTASSDSVVVGHFAPTGSVRTFQGDAEEDVTTYVAAQLEVTTTIKGDHISGGVLTVEFMAPPEAAENIPTSQAVLFLRKKHANPDIYRTVNLTGLWAATGDGAVTTPIGESAGEDSPFHDVGAIHSLADLVAYTTGRQQCLLQLPLSGCLT